MHNSYTYFTAVLRYLHPNIHTPRPSPCIVNTQGQVRDVFRVRPDGVGAPWDDPQVRLRRPKEASSVLPAEGCCGHHDHGKRWRGFIVFEGGTANDFGWVER